MPTYTIDLSSRNAMVKSTRMNIHASDESVVVRDRTLTISVCDKDKDNVTQKSDRRRNELSLKGPFELAKNATCAYEVDIRFNKHPHSVPGACFFHIAQIKMDKKNTKPLFTLGFKHDNMVAYTPGGHIVLGPSHTFTKTNVHLHVDVCNRKNGHIEWSCNGKNGKYTCADLGEANVYLKIGCYCSSDIDVGTCARALNVSYKNVKVSYP